MFIVSRHEATQRKLCYGKKWWNALGLQKTHFQEHVMTHDWRWLESRMQSSFVCAEDDDSYTSEHCQARVTVNQFIVHFKSMQLENLSANSQCEVRQHISKANYRSLRTGPSDRRKILFLQHREHLSCRWVPPLLYRSKLQRREQPLNRRRQWPTNIHVQKLPSPFRLFIRYERFLTLQSESRIEWRKLSSIRVSSVIGHGINSRLVTLLIFEAANIKRTLQSFQSERWTITLCSLESTVFL